ncbi:MAG TPA: hypothetical protein VF933_13910 [Streptosporangiaceae bacterium]
MTGRLCTRPLHLVHSTSAPADELLTALDQWARATAGGEPVAYLEVSDGELRGEFVVTAAGAAQLATLLQHAASPHADPGAAASGGTLPSRSRER